MKTPEEREQDKALGCVFLGAVAVLAWVIFSTGLLLGLVLPW